MIDREGLGNAIGVGIVGIIPAGVEFAERDVIWRVAIDLIRAHVDEWAFRAGLARSFEKIQRADSIGIEIIEGYRRRAIVGGLGGCMDNHIGTNFFHQIENPGAIADIDFVMDKAGQALDETLLIPARVALGSKKHCALVIVHPMHCKSEFIRKISAHFGTDQSG